MHNSAVIGIVGGMGPFATVDLFRRLVEAFPTEKDWEKPHIIVDSFSNIPSRVRAILYNEKKEEVIRCLAQSIGYLRTMGAENVIIGCHTAHVFLPDVFEKKPEFTTSVLNIIEAAAKHCSMRHFATIRLLASEGTVLSHIYSKYFNKVGITVVNPSDNDLVEIRKCIEAVKQNHISHAEINSFCTLMNQSDEPLLLGCSELPIMYQASINSGYRSNAIIVDPFQVVIDSLVCSL